MYSVIQMTIYDRIKKLREQQGMSQQVLAEKVGFKTASAINKIELGLRDINQTKIIAFAKALNTTPTFLMGWEENQDNSYSLPQPTITENTTTFPVIGDIAAGFEKQALEDWTGDTIEIPDTYLKGHAESEFFVLRVRGNSMYPMYHDGDKVLILKQSTLNYSGEIGAIIYNDDCGTLKKVEYKEGEDWLNLIPINPNYEPVRIEGEALNHCRVLGVPRLLIRELD